MKTARVVMKSAKVCLALLMLSLLSACEQTLIEQAGVVITDDMPKGQLLMAQMIPGEPAAVAKSNIENGMRRLLAYHELQQMKIPAVPESEREAYAVSFGVVIVPGMHQAEDENHQKLQHYFLDYAKRYNQTVIDARKHDWKPQ